MCLCIEGAMVSQYADSGTNRAGLGVGVAALYVFLVFYALGMEAASWVIPSEIFPNFIRAKGYAVAAATKSAINLVYLQVTRWGLRSWGGGILWYVFSYLFTYCLSVVYWVVTD